MARILIAEDEADLLDALVQLLEHEGHEVEGAADGVDALARFAARPFDLVMLDVMLPKIDGFAVCEAIRRQSAVPLVIVTALSDEDDQLHGFGLLADDYVTKPFSLSVVRERVRALLRRSGARAQAPGGAAAVADGFAGLAAEGSPQILSAGDVVLNVDERTALRAGEPVELTRTEFDILALMMAHKGRVFTREALVEAVWGYSYVGNARMVNLHVMNLRRKLGAEVVETVRGVGYRVAKDA
ncbi:response regulator transcription factor [Gordonibacter sp. An230]|uniref:response regulator transcription factor n=1 Tax=Gordonibacter sp. An230 TaxID=1965592 RepID=UPI0019520D56|nr:response regulator transcription factor [Gordonibacter sp. An230]